MNKLTLSPSGLKFLKDAEFFMPDAYQDSAGVWTIGYGSTWTHGRPVQKGDTTDEQGAEFILSTYVNEEIQAIEQKIKVELNQNQQDAVIILAYNIGSNAFNASTVLKRINANPNDPSIEGAWLMWDKIRKNGKLVELPGLTHRRKLEYKIFKTVPE